MQALATRQSLQAIAQFQLERLCATARIPTGNRQRLQQVFSILTGGSLDRAARPPFTGLSSINKSGLPLQWSAAAGEAVPSVRFLCECGPVGASGPVRLEESIRRIQEAGGLVGAAEGASFVAKLGLEHLVPDEWPGHWRSAMWTAAAAVGDQIGLKAYFNLTAGEPIDRWRRAGRLLAALGRRASLERFCRYSAVASRDSWPVGIAIGIGGCARETGGVKVYFRSGAVSPAWLDSWYRAVEYPDAAEPVRLLLETFAPPGEAPYPAGSLVVSVEFPASDELPAIKTELEVDRWGYRESETVARVSRLLHALGIEGTAYDEAREALRCDPGASTMHRLVGVRTDSTGTRRANVYWEPPLPGAPEARIARRGRSGGWGMEAAIAWLAGERCGRTARGGWSDFKLPVGRSDCWVTAYVSLAVAEPAPELALEGCRWLSLHRGPGGSWGYNAVTPGDSDSTALAVLAFRQMGMDPGGMAIDLLKSCTGPKGGVSTYPVGVEPGGAWCEGVEDVTPVAAAALGGVYRAEALDWLVARQREDGLWNAYWWTTPLYAASWVARVYGDELPGECRGRLLRALQRWRPAGAFDHALLILALQALGEPCDQRRRELLGLQRADGSWSASAWLRLSRPAVREPWRAIDSGACFPDSSAVFTTATAIAALSAAGRSARR